MLDTFRLLDNAQLAAINGLAGQSAGLDRLVIQVANNHALKGVFVMMLFWGLWFAHERLGPYAREKLLSVLVVAIVAIFVGRGLALLLPFRSRPIHASELDAELAIGLPPIALGGMSSMPSDHAVMYFALAVGLFLVSRPVGLIALAHALLVICVPRVYLGLHFPSDIFVGALVGAGISLALVPLLTRLMVRHHALKLAMAYPYLLYPAMFFVTFQAGSMFESLRALLTETARGVGLI